MKRRNIFFAISFVCLSIFILSCAYLIKEDNTYSNAQQEEEQQKEASNTEPVPAIVNPVTPATKYTDSPQQTTSQLITPAEDNNAVIEDNYLVPGCKVGDIVKLGDVELLVTQATERYKVIEIAIEGNESGEQPKLILQEPDKIIYEIPADVDVNVDVSEKVHINKS